MNDFKYSRSSPRSNSVDGFSTPRPRSSAGYTSRRPASQPTRSSSSFSRADGFHSTVQQQFAKPFSGSARIEPAFPAIEPLGKPKLSRKELRKQKKAARSKTRRRVIRSVKVFSLLLIIGIGSFLGYGYMKARKVFSGAADTAPGLQENVQPIQLKGEGDGRVNILILGKGGPGHEAPDLTDTLLLASIDPIQNDAALLSVPRDLYVKNENGASMKINAIYSNAKELARSEDPGLVDDKDAYEKAGTDAIKATVEEVLGVPVHYYVMVDFEAFRKGIDTVGGITINVEEPLVDYTMAWLNGGNPTLADVGTQTFDGKRALFYARSRYGSERGDFDRTERQRQVIVALKDKVLSTSTLANPYKIQQLIGTFGDNVSTDIGLNEIGRLVEIGQKIGNDKIASVGLADPPNVLVGTDQVGGQSVVVPKAGVYVYSQIQSYIRNNLRDAFLKNEDAKIIVLNGTTTAGLAGKTADELKSYGYTVTKVDNAPTKDYTNTYVVDVSNGAKPFTKSYLEKRLEVTAVSQLPDATIDTTGADFVIVIGQNEANRQQN